MTQRVVSAFSIRSLMLFTAAMSVVLFASTRSGYLLPFVLPLGLALAIFAASNDSWLYLWMLSGGLLGAAAFYLLTLSTESTSDSEPGASLMFVLGAYLGMSAGLLTEFATRRLGLSAIGLFVVLIGALELLLLPDVQ